MALKYKHLLGRPYDKYHSNCFTLVRDYFRDNHDIRMRDYAFPNMWWEQGLDLFNKHYADEGFEALDCHPRHYRASDVVLIAHGSPVANHVGVLLDNGKFLHHFYTQTSREDPYASGGYWRSLTVAVLRHRDLKELPPPEPVDLWSLLPSHVRQRMDHAKPPEGAEFPTFGGS